MIAEVSGLLIADLLSGRLTAVLCVTGVVIHAELTNVQFRIAGLAHVKAPQREAQVAQRGAAIPADERMQSGNDDLGCIVQVSDLSSTYQV